MSRLRIDVGGTVYATCLETVTKHKASGSHLSRIFDGEPINVDSATGTREYFIDRDPRSFGYILQWLRDERTVIVPNDADKDRLLAECRWYGPFIGGDPIVMTDMEYNHAKVYGNSSSLSIPVSPARGLTPGVDHAKNKYYSLQLS